VDELAAARIGGTFNQYAEGIRSSLLRSRLVGYLAARDTASILLVGEAPGYRGARVSGIPFTSERQLTGSGPAEATATIVHRVLRELAIEDDVLLWNVVPTHPGPRRRTACRRVTRSPSGRGSSFPLPGDVASSPSAESPSASSGVSACGIRHTGERVASEPACSALSPSRLTNGFASASGSESPSSG